MVRKKTSSHRGWGMNSLCWHLFEQGWAGVGVVLLSPRGGRTMHSKRLLFTTTNNEAKIEAVLAALWLAKAVGARILEIRSDSKVGLITYGRSINWAIRNQGTKTREISKNCWGSIALLSTSQIRQNTTKRQYGGWCSGTSRPRDISNVYVEELKSHFIEGVFLDIIFGHDDWRASFANYLKTSATSTDPKEPYKLRVRVARFYLTP